MIADEYAYIGRDNVINRVLLIDGAVLSSDDKAAITRVTAKFGSYCLDTDVADDNITYSDGTVSLTLGLVSGIKKGLYTVKLIVYDPTMTNGKAWDSFTVFVDNWDACNDS